MVTISVNRHYNIVKPKNERLNLKISEEELKIIDELASKRNLNRSEFLRDLVEKEKNKYTRSFSTYKCDECGVKIKLGAEYYCEVGSVEKQVKEGNKIMVEVIKGKDLGILCYPCAKKLKAIDYIDTEDPTYPTNLVKDSNRTIHKKKK